MRAIVIEKLNKRFGENLVLEDFSAVFPAGETTCIMGDSGCGKTTLLNILMGFEQADSGQVSGIPERKSAVFQEDRLCETFGAVSNIRFVLKKRAVEEEIRAHLKELGLLEETLQKPVSSFSGGMKRRVAIARAICFDGDILFLDEPFKGLDEMTRRTAVSYVKKHTAGKTVVMVTHDEEEVTLMGGRLIRMEAKKS